MRERCILCVLRLCGECYVEGECKREQDHKSTMNCALASGRFYQVSHLKAANRHLRSFYLRVANERIN
jgi:hypothetical protein